MEENRISLKLIQFSFNRSSLQGPNFKTLYCMSASHIKRPSVSQTLNPPSSHLFHQPLLSQTLNHPLISPPSSAPSLLPSLIYPHLLFPLSSAPSHFHHRKNPRIQRITLNWKRENKDPYSFILSIENVKMQVGRSGRNFC